MLSSPFIRVSPFIRTVRVKSSNFFTDLSRENIPKYKLRIECEAISPTAEIIKTPVLDPDIGYGLTLVQAKEKLDYFLTSCELIILQ